MLKLEVERRRRSLSQAKMAERLGVGHSTYAKTEEGVYVPGKDSPFGTRLSRVFGMTLRRLLSEV